MDFKRQMETLQARSDATMELGPPDWLTRPRCLEGPLSAEEVRWGMRAHVLWALVGFQPAQRTRPHHHHSKPRLHAQLDQFFEEGYLIKHEVFSKAELQPVIHDIDAQVLAV